MSYNHINDFVDNKYDEELMELEHYKSHPEMLPFVGLNYDKLKIMIIGESHYIDDKKCKWTVNNEADFTKTWYGDSRNDIKKLFENWEDAKYWFYTRYVVCRNVLGGHSRSSGIFFKPAGYIAQNNDIEKEDALESITFMNYFLRPAAEKGESINTSREDLSHARENLNKVIEILKPELIIFVSKKAYSAYGDYNNPKVKYTTHPCSSWWTKSTDHGKSYFEELMKSYPCKVAKTSIQSVIEIKTGLMKNYFDKIIIGLERENFKVGNKDRLWNDIEVYYNDEKTDLPTITIDSKYDLKVDWNLYITGGKKWDYIRDEKLDEKKERLKFNFKKPNGLFLLDDNEINEKIEIIINGINDYIDNN